MDEALRRQYLQAMGVQLYRERESNLEASPVPGVGTTTEGRPAQNSPDNPTADASSRQTSVEPHPEAPPGWLDEVPPPDAEWAPSLQLTEDAPAVKSNGIATLSWEKLQQRVADCTACSLHASRTNTVFGVGDRAAKLMVVGEAPGAEEDRKGEPFVGRAGKLLDAMLLAIGLQRSDVFIANILKCRPPDNRDPRADEALQCEPFLLRQVALVQPQVILAVGRVAAQNLLKSQQAVGRLRGQDHQFQGIPVIVSYHPAYLLRSPEQKVKSWQDLQRAARVLRG